MKTRLIVMAAAFALSACNRGPAPTAPGTTLLVAIFGASEGGPPLGVDVSPTRTTTKVPVERGAEVEVRLDVAEVNGGKYLHKVEVAVIGNGGGFLTAELPKGQVPVNRGTEEQPVASMRLMVTWRKENLGSSSLSQTSIDLSADGTVSAQ